VGIDVCDTWFNSFKAFYADMGNRPSKPHSIDRRDGAKGYSKENCIWATRREQSINRKTTRWLEFESKKVIMQELADILGVSRDKVKYYANKGESGDQISVRFNYQNNLK
jgi:hypothetical protein